MSRRLPLVGALLMAVYLPFLTGGFVTDDFAHLEHLGRARGAAALAAAPDSFGFYRPITQASLWIDLQLFGRNATAFRAVNLVLHGAVLTAVFFLARLVVPGPAAAVAALAFALTPKAHPIAVLWISARAELLMSLGAVTSIGAWIVWSRNGRAAWLTLAAGGYVFALLSKETAVLLPLLLLAAPGAKRPWRSRIVAAALFGGLAGALFIWRLRAGALAPVSVDAHYNLSTPVARWLRNLRNYAGRMAPAPLTLIALAGAATLARDKRVSIRTRFALDRGILVFAGVWVLVFLAPVIPIASRSELYLYLPVFGPCLLVASLLDPVLRHAGAHRLLTPAIACYVIVVAGYQASRSFELHRDARFSAALVRALEDEPAVNGPDRPIVLSAADPHTGRLLRDAIGGYLPVVLRQLDPARTASARVVGDGAPAHLQEERIRCHYRDSRVWLTVNR